MTNEEILDIRRRALVEAAQIASDMAEQNRTQAVQLHQRAAKQARLYSEEAGDNTKISAQVLDACAVECRCIAERILALAPKVIA